MINQVGQHRGAIQYVTDTSRTRDLLRMNPRSFTDSCTIEDQENIIEELKKVFDLMYVTDIKRVELFA